MLRKDWQEDLLAGGILGVLKAWLEPINGCLPLLEVCQTLHASVGFCRSRMPTPAPKNATITDCETYPVSLKLGRG